MVLGLALGPTVSLGFARFGYGLILPAMRSDLAWSYAQAGWINTANAVGYLIGAVLALRGQVRWELAVLFRWGMALTAMALCASATTDHFMLQVWWRTLAGIGGALVFIAGAAMAAAAFKTDPAKNAFAITLYFGGIGLGIFLSAILIPAILRLFGPTAWKAAWLALGLASIVALIPCWSSSRQLSLPPNRSAVENQLPWSQLVPSLLAYLLFGVGYIVYMTFLVAWMKDSGASALAIAATWSVLGLSAMLSPYPWRSLLTRHAGGIPLAYACMATAAGCVLPLLISNHIGQLLSSIVFGLSFPIAPAAVTAFSKKNLRQEQWAAAVAAYTAIFAIGQTLGPVGAGWLADSAGNLSWGLIAAAVILFAAGAVALFQLPRANEGTGPSPN